MFNSLFWTFITVSIVGVILGSMVTYNTIEDSCKKGNSFNGLQNVYACVVVEKP